MVHRIVVFAALGLSLSACWFGPEPEVPPCASCTRQVNEYEQHREAYQTLASQLLSKRSLYLSKQYSYPRAVGNAFFCFTFPGWDPVLHRVDGQSGARVDYQFSIGSGADGANFRASQTLVVTGRRMGDVVRYIAWDATKPATEVARLDVPSPRDEQRWWAYAVFENSVYLVTQEPGSAAHWLNRWQPGQAMEKLFTLESATGTQLGEFLDFDVEGDALMFIEGGRLWNLSLASRRASWMHNSTEISGSVDFRSDFILWEAADGLHSLNLITGLRENLSQVITSSTWRLNSDFVNLQRYDGDFTRWNEWIIYKASSGVFAFSLITHETRPVLLPLLDADIRVVYRYPVALSGGQLIVMGLESSSGSVGAEGPLYRVDLNDVLH